MPKKLNLIGERYGKLTVIAEAENIKDRTAWLCQCDCGQTKIVRTKELRNGIVQSCGCLKSEKSNIKIGDKFDKLTVLEKLNKRIGGCVVWKCQCECGNIIERTTTTLHKDRRHSCGCYERWALGQLQAKNLIGQKFGKLLVIKQGSRDTNNNIRWECKCDCGSIIEIQTNRLTTGNTSSCGCINYSIGEKNIKTILDQNQINYKTQWTCSELKLKKYDFAIVDENNKNIIRLIEFDGRQHYDDISGIWGSKENLIDIQRRDQEKNEYALSHNIPLVRIPYWERDNITLDMIMGDQYLVQETELAIK